jgi:acetyltransferase-like isoleucine patch superfamily enzyme
MRPGISRTDLDIALHPMRRIALRARLTRPYWRIRFYRYGKATILHRPAWIFGAGQIAIGNHCLILGGCYIAAEKRAWDRPAPVLSIGDRVGIRPYCMISASESIVIEDDVIIGAFSSVIDSDHTFAEGRPNVMHNPVNAAPIRIGRGTWLAERVAVLRGTSIGRCCIVGANSVVREDLPDYTIAAGVPARVVGEVTGVNAHDRTFTDGLW